MTQKSWYSDLTLESFVVLESNKAAVDLASEILHCPSEGMLAAIIGPSGSGSTHLVGGLVNVTNRRNGSETSQLISAEKLQENLHNPLPGSHLIAIDSLHSFGDNQSTLGLVRDLTVRARESGRTVVLSAELSMKEAMLELWPKIRLAEIHRPTPQDRFKVAVSYREMLSLMVPTNILIEIAEKSGSIREAVGYLFHYDACVKLGAPDSFRW